MPEVAIGYDQMGPFVRLVNDKNIVERREVKLGVQVDNDRVVMEGLQGEEWVVVSGLLRAIPGRQVTPEKSAAQPGLKPPKPPVPKPRSRPERPPHDLQVFHRPAHLRQRHRHCHHHYRAGLPF